MTEWVVSREVCNDLGVAREIKPRDADFPHYNIEVRFATNGRVTLMARKIEHRPGYAQEIEELPPFLLEHIVAMSVKMLGVLKSPKRRTCSHAFKEGCVSEYEELPEGPGNPVEIFDDDPLHELEPEDFALEMTTEAAQAAITAIAAAAREHLNCARCRHWLSIASRNQAGVPIGSCGNGRSPYSGTLTTAQDSCGQHTTAPRSDGDVDGNT